MSSQSRPRTSGKDKSGRGMLISFFLVPLISSILSTIHIVVFAMLGNTDVMSIVIAGTYEVGAITSFVVVANKKVLKYINRGAMMFIFIALFLVQAVGNLYSVFSYIYERIDANPEYLEIFKRMSFNTLDDYASAMIIGVLVGVLLPLISLIFLKSAADYFYAKPDDDEDVAVEAPEPEEPPLPDLMERAMRNVQDVDSNRIVEPAKPRGDDLQPPTADAVEKASEKPREQEKKKEMPEKNGKREVRLPSPEDEKSTMSKSPLVFKKKKDEPKPEDDDEPEPEKNKRGNIKMVDDRGITGLDDKGERVPTSMPFQSGTMKRKNRFLDK